VQREKIGSVWQHSRMGFALAFVITDITDDLLVSARADIGTLTMNPVPIDVADMLDGIMRTDLTECFERVDIEGIQVTPFADPCTCGRSCGT